MLDVPVKDHVDCRGSRSWGWHRFCALIAMNRKLSERSSQVQRAHRRTSVRPLHPIMDRLQKALCEPARLDIVQSLQAGELSVSEIAAIIDRTPSSTSQHLRVLRDAGLVEGLRHGMSMRYRLRSSADGQRLQDVLGLLERGATT